jgi:hypothetical protein
VRERVQVVDIAEAIILKMQRLIEFKGLEGVLLIMKTYFEIFLGHQCLPLLIFDTWFAFHFACPLYFKYI